MLRTTISFSVRTVWEIKQKTLVDMAVDRGCYIDQSQSLNIHMDQPNFGKLTSLHFYAWSKVFIIHTNRSLTCVTHVHTYIYVSVLDILFLILIP